jgi:hypothetical protein
VNYDTNFTLFYNLSAVIGNSYQESTITLPVMPEGIHALSAYVDPFNTIPELNETNNIDLLSMRIVHRFEILAISWVDENGDAEFGPGDTLKVDVQSNLSPGSLSQLMVKESDTVGAMNGYLNMSGGDHTPISMTIDHVIPDIASALILVVEL